VSTILVINSSILGAASASRRLAAAVVERLRAADPNARLISRDVGSEPLPHVSGATLAGFAGGATMNGEAAAARSLSDTLIAELAEADTLVIGAPMYNFGVPTTLQAWFDHVLRAGVTFRYTAEGSIGLMTGKRAIVVESRGGYYSDGPGVGMDGQEPHLRTMLGFIGITDVTFIRAEKLAISAEEREASLAAAIATIGQLVPAPAIAA
jgi:FMN-dependent NADH-azoreductase